MKKKNNEFEEVFNFLEKKMDLTVLDSFKQVKKVIVNENFRFRHTSSEFHKTNFLICKYFYKPIYLNTPLNLPKNEKKD